MRINNNKRRTKICRLKSGDQWVDDVEGLKNRTKEFFENRYREERLSRPILDGVTFQKISDADNFAPIPPFSVEEVKGAV